MISSAFAICAGQMVVAAASLVAANRSSGNFILEGPDVVEKNYKGGIIQPGWRHYRCIFKGRAANGGSPPCSADMARQNFNAKLFPRGTWEIDSPVLPLGGFPAMRP